MKMRIFSGAATALITPFCASGGVDYGALGALVDFQLEEGINALVVCGTTGESSTLTEKERREVISFVAGRAGGRVPIIAGTGSNDAAKAAETTKRAADLGADAALCVTPYYNKATQSGLVETYKLIADGSRIPVILYNVPSRTGVNIEPETYLKLAEHENIVAIKEASGNISNIVRTAALTRGKLDLYSGNDDQVIPILSVGGIGVISVLSNVMPKKTVEMCDKFLSGNLRGAAEIQLELTEIIKLLFSEVNPIPVKAALWRMGICENELRLPLTPMSDEKREKLFTEMRRLGLRFKG